MYDKDAVEALNTTVWGSLPPISAALTAVYLIFTVSHWFLIPPPAKASMVLMAGATALVLAAIALSVRYLGGLRRFAHPIALLIIVLLGTNSAAHVYLTQDIVHTTNVMLVVLGAGFIVLAAFWYVLALCFSLGAWLLAANGLSDQSLFTHFSFALFSSTVASVVFRYVHVRYLVENNRLRLTSESQRREMEHLATHDALTGLANRRKFVEVLTEQIAHARRQDQKLGVLYIDLNEFKQLNDANGHEFGDEVLRQTGSALSALIRETDLVGRLGGDEFSVLLTGIKRGADLDVVVAKIRRHFERPLVINGSETVIGLSIGQAVLPDEAERLDDLLHKADLRMYAEKERLREAARKPDLKVYSGLP